MDIVDIKAFKKGTTRLVDLVEVLFRQNGLLLTRPGYSLGVHDWEVPKEEDYRRQIREDGEAFERTQPAEYRNEPSVKPPYLEFFKYLEGHNQGVRGGFPVRVGDIVGIRRLGIAASAEQSKYIPSGLVEVKHKNPMLPEGSEIRAGYLQDTGKVAEAWGKNLSKPPYIDLYTHLENGAMRSPLRMESGNILRLNRLYMAESIGFS